MQPKKRWLAMASTMMIAALLVVIFLLGMQAVGGVA